MTLCGTASLWAKLAFVASLIAMVLDIAGFATASWMAYQVSDNSVRVGLWKSKSCTGNTCTETDVDDSFIDDTFRATQVFQTMALILFLLTPVAVAIYVFLPGARSQCLAIASLSMCFTAGLLSLLGMICWLAYVPDPYVASYSLGLVVLATLLIVIAGMLLIPDVLDGGHHPNRIRDGWSRY